MSQTRSQIRSIGDILGKKPKEFTLIDPPLISAPNTSIVQLNGLSRALPDPSKRLSPIIGFEMIPFYRLERVNHERGVSGQPVWRPIGGDERVRAVGYGWYNISSDAGTRPETQTADDFLEVTFYGTGLNMMFCTIGSTTDVRATTDGGAEGSNFIPNSGAVSGVLFGRRQRTNTRIPVVNGLALGTHTVKIRFVSGVLSVAGLEVVNDSTQMRLLPGELYSSGRKYVQSAIEAFAYNSGFDGSPVLNGRGGRVLIYKNANGTTGRAIQQVDASTLYTTAADHTNEVPHRLINVREFGSNLSNDFSTLSGAQADAAYHLEDNSTALQARSCTLSNYVSGQGDQIDNAAITPQSVGTSFIEFSFVGTGLDVRRVHSSLGATNTTISIDGTVVATETGTFGTSPGLYKVVSGLPYGQHVVRFSYAGGSSFAILDFIVYTPKKPTLPADAVPVGEYFLMADYAALTTAGMQTISRGVVRKFMAKEFVYVGSGFSINLAVNANIGGFEVGSSSNGSYREITFWGTGFNLRGEDNVSASANVTFLLNGTALNTTNFPTITTGTVGGFSFNGGTGVLNMTAGSSGGSSVQITNLPLARYTLRITNNTANTTWFDCIDIVTPIHVMEPTLKLPSLACKPLTVLNRDQSASTTDLSKAKALLLYDPQTGRILQSRNVAWIINVATGRIIAGFTTPFKNSNIVVLASLNRHSGPGSGPSNFFTHVTNVTPDHVQIDTLRNDAAQDNSIMAMACFGELVDEGNE